MLEVMKKIMERKRREDDVIGIGLIENRRENPMMEFRKKIILNQFENDPR